MSGYVSHPPGGPADGFDEAGARVERGAGKPAILPSARSGTARPQTRAADDASGAD